MYENDLISIIVPVYNTQDYLDKCLTSIINQTYKNIEIIIIDDGSTDNSKEIIKKYMNNDNRILYYHQKNSGVGIARNKGINLSRGNYITFIDSDDYINEKYIEKMYMAIKPDDAFSICGTINVSYDGKEKSVNVNKKLVDTFRGIAQYRRFINKKILLESQIKFSDVKICEDLEFYSKLMIYSDMKYSIVDESLYYYVQRENSLIHTYEKNQEDTLKSVNNIIAFCKDNDRYETYKNELEYLYIAHVIAGYAKRIILSGISEEEFKKIISKITIKFPNWYNNKYINNKEYIPEIYLPYLEYLKYMEFNKAFFYIKNTFK